MDTQAICAFGIARVDQEIALSQFRKDAGGLRGDYAKVEVLVLDPWALQGGQRYGFFLVRQTVLLVKLDNGRFKDIFGQPGMVEKLVHLVQFAFQAREDISRKNNCGGLVPPRTNFRWRSISSIRSIKESSNSGRTSRKWKKSRRGTFASTIQAITSIIK